LEAVFQIYLIAVLELFYFACFIFSTFRKCFNWFEKRYSACILCYNFSIWSQAMHGILR